MKASERRELAKTELESVHIEFSVDDELLALVVDNTNAKMPRASSNVLKCLTLVAGGSALATACKLTGVNVKTLTRWRSQEWYARAIVLIQKRLDDQLDGKFTHALNKGMSRLTQRLDVGDPVMSKDGTINYKPVSAKDAAIISSILFDKRSLLRNKPTTISTSVSTEERLTNLAQKFKDIAIDADYEVVNEQADEQPILIDNEVTDNGQRLKETTTASVTGTTRAELAKDICIQESRKTNSDETRFSFASTERQDQVQAPQQEN